LGKIQVFCNRRHGEGQVAIDIWKFTAVKTYWTDWCETSLHCAELKTTWNLRLRMYSG